MEKNGKTFYLWHLKFQTWCFSTTRHRTGKDLPVQGWCGKEWWFSAPLYNTMVGRANFITSHVSGWCCKDGAVCLSLCVCQFVNTLTTERIDEWSRNLTQGLTLLKSRTSSMVNVTRSKNVMSMIFWLQCQYAKCWPMVWRHDVTAWRHLSSCCEMGSARRRCSNTLVFFYLPRQRSR